MKALLIFCGFLGVHGVRATITGAPNTPEVCDTMAPSVYSHGAGPQTSTSPYKIVVDSGQTYIPGQEIQVKVEKIDPATEDIMGFFLQARPVNSSDTVGTFSDVINGKTITCGTTGADNAATHSGSKKKVIVAANWTPPASLGDIIFFATVAQTQQVYWVKIQSAIISPSSEEETTTKETSSTTGITTKSACAAFNHHLPNTVFYIHPFIILNMLICYINTIV